MTADTYIALLALVVSVVSIIMSLHTERGQRATRIAEKRNQIRCQIAEAELLWQQLRADAHNLLRDLKQTGKSLTPDLQDTLDNILKVATSIRECHPEIDEGTQQSEANVERRLAAAIEMNTQAKQMEAHAREVMKREKT